MSPPTPWRGSASWSRLAIDQQPCWPCSDGDGNDADDADEDDEDEVGPEDPVCLLAGVLKVDLGGWLGSPDDAGGWTERRDARTRLGDGSTTTTTSRRASFRFLCSRHDRLTGPLKPTLAFYIC